MGLEHDALIYAGAEEFLVGTCAFIEEGLDADDAVMVAVPGSKLGAIRAALSHGADSVRLVDMHELGRNPGRILPEVRDWVGRAAPRRCRFIGEPIWPGRTEAETVEATRHEALINLALAGADVHVLCPYDASRLDPAVISDAARTHPQLIREGRRGSSACFVDPLELWASEEWPLPEPVGAVLALDIDGDLAALRASVGAWAHGVGVPAARTADLVLAVDEAATNSLTHGCPPVSLRAWCSGDSAICEVVDRGRLDAPLAGRVRPEPDWPSGRGVWLMNQLCDLVELRPAGDRTTIRIHSGTT